MILIAFLFFRRLGRESAKKCLKRRKNVPKRAKRLMRNHSKRIDEELSEEFKYPVI